MPSSEIGQQQSAMVIKFHGGSSGRGTHWVLWDIWCDGLEALLRGSQAGGKNPPGPGSTAGCWKRAALKGGGKEKGPSVPSVFFLPLQTWQLLREAMKQVCFSWVLAVNSVYSSADYTSAHWANYSIVIKGVRTFWSTFRHLLSV